MAARLDTPEGKALYKQRKAIIEPVFAQLFARFGRHLNYRGNMVTTEIHLWAAVHNLLKAIRARARREQRERQAAARSPPGSRITRPQARNPDQQTQARLTTARRTRTGSGTGPEPKSPLG